MITTHTIGMVPLTVLIVMTLTVALMTITFERVSLIVIGVLETCSVVVINFRDVALFTVGGGLINECKLSVVRDFGYCC